MQAQIDIGFDQLVKLAKQLPKSQWTKLKTQVEGQAEQADPQPDMLSFLLGGPTFSQKQVDEIVKARTEIAQWRTK